MKFTCKQNDLNNAIQMVTKAISSKSTLPILSGIYIETHQSRVKLVGNDLNLCIETTIEASIEREGNIVIPARLFSELIRKLPNESLSITVNESEMIDIQCLDSQYKLVGLHGNEYPSIPTIDESNAFSMDKELFANMIKQTHFAISQDESRPILTGALLEIENGHFNMVAIDGFRMAIKKAMIKTDISKKAVVPGRTLSEINKLLSQIDSKGDLKIAFDDKQVSFKVSDFNVYSRLLAGDFINYNQILPQEFKSNAIVNTDDLLVALDRSFLLARENKNVSIKMDIKDDLVTISSNSEVGNSVEKVRIKLEGSDIEIGFNPKYLMDALKVIDQEDVRISFINNVSPCIIQPLDNETYTYLVLPCRISR